MMRSGTLYTTNMSVLRAVPSITSSTAMKRIISWFMQFIEHLVNRHENSKLYS
jgi:hypothetical protein